MNEFIENAAIFLGCAVGGYTALLFGTQLIGDLASQKIHSQEELDKIVNEEADKLGMDKRTLMAKFYSICDKDYKTIRGARCFVGRY